MRSRVVLAEDSDLQPQDPTLPSVSGQVQAHSEAHGYFFLGSTPPHFLAPCPSGKNQSFLGTLPSLINRKHSCIQANDPRSTPSPGNTTQTRVSKLLPLRAWWAEHDRQLRSKVAGSAHHLSATLSTSTGKLPTTSQLKTEISVHLAPAAVPREHCRRPQTPHRNIELADEMHQW